MKRPYLLLFLLVLIGTITGTATAQDQNTSRSFTAFILTANNDTVRISVNTEVDIPVLDNDVETNPGASIFLETDLVREPLHGVAEVDRKGGGNEDDVIHYTPDDDFAGVDSLIYRISNNFTAEDEATVLIFINEPPDAEPDSYRVLPNRSTQLNVLDNDSDEDGDELEIEEILTVPLNGAAGLALNKTVIVYTPNSDFVGKDSLEYVVTDNLAGFDTTKVRIVVNTLPEAMPDMVSTLPRTSIDIEVLDNDTDADGDELTIVEIVDAPDRGTASIIEDGTEIRYTPTGGLTGTDLFQYSIMDPQGGGDTTTVTVQVNTPPDAVDDEAMTVLETSVDIDVLDNDTDPENDPLTVVSVEDPENGTVAILSNDNIRYTPDNGFIGTDTFDYTISDGEGGEDTAEVSVVVVGNALVQFIHNALPPNPVDIYVNDTRVVNDLDFQDATPFLEVIGSDVSVDVTDGSATNNSDPIFSTTLELEPTENFIAIATGLAEQNFSFEVKENARTGANPGFMDFFVAHGVLDAAASGLDVRILDPLNDNLPSEILADNLNFGELTDYTSQRPGIFNIDVTTFDGSTVFDVYQFNLGGLDGQSFTLLLSGLLNPTGNDPAFTLIGFDNFGNSLVPTIVTAAEDALELPTEFVLRGNFPNPFNPTTTLQFDLPETAEVSVEIVDMLGRSVLTLPAQQVEAGVNRSLDVNASSLASGTYLYRVRVRTLSQTLVRTGRMTLVK